MLVKALSHAAIFHATCNAILHLRDVNYEDCLICEEYIEDAYLLSLIINLSTVELRCKLQKKFHRVTWPRASLLSSTFFKFIAI